MKEKVKVKEKDIIEKLKEQKKLPKEVKDKILKGIADCTFSAIIAYLYFIFLNLGLKNIHQNIFVTDLKVFGVSLAIIAIIFFEKAYNHKESKNLYRGIEILVMAILTMLILYFVLYLTPNYGITIPIFAILFNVYFILKALLMIYKIRNDYRKETSDIKEIIKK